MIAEVDISTALQCILTTEEMYTSGQGCFENLFQLLSFGSSTKSDTNRRGY